MVSHFADLKSFIYCLITLFLILFPEQSYIQIYPQTYLILNITINLLFLPYLYSTLTFVFAIPHFYYSCQK